MKTYLTMIGALAMFVASSSFADEIDASTRLAANHVAVMSCANCHGPQGRSYSPKFPVLAGQHAGYLAAQLKAFKAQTRGDPDALGYMWGMSAALDEDMIVALADYYSRQTPASGRGRDTAAIARGKEIYANGVAAEGIPPCATCHGPNAAGTDEFPRLAGQHAQYLLKQLRSFQSNLRNVAVMHGVAKELQITEMKSVAAYLESLGGA
jgi:cytochrome c553